MFRLFIFVISSLSISVAIAEPDFVGNHFVGQPITKMSTKYGNALEKFECGSSTQSACSAKGIKCECRAVRLVAEPTHGRTLLATISNQMIIGYSDIFTVLPRTNMAKVLPTVRSFFGDEKPAEIYDLNTGGDGYQGQFLIWKLPEGGAQAVVFCPMTSVAGIKKVESKVRDCLLKDARISTHKAVDIPSEAKNKSKLEY